MRNLSNGTIKGIVLSVILLLVGIAFFVLAFLSLAGVVATSATIFFLLSAITLIPGTYYTVIAFRAWRGDRGFNFSDIPEL